MMTKKTSLQNKERLCKGSGDECRLPSEAQVSESLSQDNNLFSKSYELIHTSPFLASVPFYL